jgi:hypothetical protein
VVVVGLDRAPAAVRESPRTAAVLAELHLAYRQVATSRPTGLVTVWAAARAP